VILIKVGGGDTINLAGVAEDLAGLDDPVILVHGANALRDRLAERLGITVRRVTSVSGMTSVLTDDATVDLMMMAYAGLSNARLVELLQRHGVNAVGLSGIDGRVIQARRNPGIRVRENGKLKLLRDLSGRPCAINRELLDLLLAHRYTPVLTVPLADEQGIAVNSENDDVVALLHSAYHAETVVQLIEAPGLLADPDDETTRIQRLSRGELADWEERASGRIRRKLRAIGTLLDRAATRVVVSDGRAAHPLRDALAGVGTVIR
jgi:acetylglutamate/LysW-gamma-L-alpha-aminoadipate kinase